MLKKYNMVPGVERICSELEHHILNNTIANQDQILDALKTLVYRDMLATFIQLNDKYKEPCGYVNGDVVEYITNLSDKEVYRYYIKCRSILIANITK